MMTIISPLTRWPNLVCHYNKPYFNSLVKNLKALNEDYGEWSSFNLFDAVLKNYDSLLEHFGVIVENSDTPSPYVHFYK